MPLVETATEVYIKTQEPLLEAGPDLPNPTQLKRRRWILLFATFPILLASLLYNGVLNLRQQHLAHYHSALKTFEWMVLTQGTQIEVDELGRALKQLEGVSEVSYVTSEEAFAVLKNDPLVKDRLSDVDESFVLPSWRVKWSPIGFKPESQHNLILDTMRLPGVVDIGFDEKALSIVQNSRRFWLEVSVASGVVTFTFLIAFLIIGGRFLFFTPAAIWNPRRFFRITGSCAAVWLMGYAAIWSLLGAVPFYGALAGIFVGATVAMALESLR